MTTVIIEDELPQAKQLQQLLTEIDSSIDVLDILTSVNESIAFLSLHQVDLIFLDIHLSDGLCFEIFDKVNINCPVIFTTAYDKYAIQAFKHNGIDYLLKPILKSELIISIDKFKSFTNSAYDYAHLFNSLKSMATNMKAYKKRLVSQAGKKMKIIATADIAYFFALGGGVFIKTYKNETLLIEQTLENLEEELDPYEFFRLNRQVIANVSAIKEMYPFSKSRLKIALIPEFTEDVIVSYKNIKAFMQWIKK
jgi:DNA-binding LytR/AlgR family response regulator